MKKLILAIFGFLAVINIGKLTTIFERKESDFSTEMATSSTSGTAQNLRGPRSSTSSNAGEEIELSLFDFNEASENLSGVPRDELIEFFNPEPIQSQGLFEALANRHPIDRAAAIYESRWGSFVNSLDLSDSDKGRLKNMLVDYDAYNIELRDLFMSGEISQEEQIAARRSLEQLAGALSSILSDDQMDMFWNTIERQKNQLNQQFAEWDAQYLENGLVGILDAANRNDTATVAVYISSGADVNAMTLDGSHTPLIDAAYNGNVEITRMLLEAGANPNMTSTDGYDTSPLAAAVRRGNIEVIHALAAAGADLNLAAQTAPGSTPLATAALFGQTEAALTLINLGADVTGEAGALALTNAIRYGGHEIEQALLEAGADSEHILVISARESREIGRNLGVVND